MLSKQQANQARELLQSTAFDQFTTAPQDLCVFRMHFKRIGSLGDFILFTGKKSSGKTKVVSAGIAAALSQEEIFKMSIKLPSGKRKIAHFDTEQGKGSHYRMMQLIKKFAQLDELPEHHFKSFRCRCVAPHLIRYMVEYYLENNQDCGMIYLDGMLDTVDSMNDEKQANVMKQWLQRLSEQYNVLFAGIIHRGFSADKAIGHIGSYLERGAQTVLKIERDKKDGFEFFKISTEYIRDDSPPPDTAFFYNNNTNTWELYEINQEIEITPPGMRKVGKNSPLQYDIQEHRRRCGQIFDSTGHLLQWDELIREIQMAYACSQTEAKKDFYQYLLSEGLIFKTTDGYTNDRKPKLFIQK